MTENTRQYVKALIVTSLPVMLQQFLQNSLSFIDTLMIGRLGEVHIAAIGLGNELFFFISVLIFGIASGTGIFFSQYWGAKNTDGIQKTMGISLFLGTSVSLIFSLISIFYPSLLINIFTDEPPVVAVGCEYLRWVGISYVFTAVSQVFSTALRCTGDTRSPMWITFFSMLMDIAGNYLLIFVLGWGAAGAAIATAVSRLFEMAALYALIKFRSPVSPKMGLMFSFEWKFVRDVLRISMPVIIDDTFWALGLVVYKAIFSRMGIAVLASTNVSESAQNLFFTMQNGLGAGTAILIGNTIGRKEYDKAQENAKISYVCALVIGLFSLIIMAGLSPVLPKLFNLSDAAREMAEKSILILALTLPFKFLNHLSVCGIFRSGGDTRFTLFVELFSIWAIGVPTAYFAGIVWGLPIWLVYLTLTLEEVSKLAIMTPRFFSRRWINDLVN